MQDARPDSAWKSRGDVDLHDGLVDLGPLLAGDLNHVAVFVGDRAYGPEANAADRILAQNAIGVDRRLLLDEDVVTGDAGPAHRRKCRAALDGLRRPLLPLEVGRALLAERLRALLGVLGHEDRSADLE